MYFKNRTDAGTKLASSIGALPPGEVVIYGLARGGLVVARELANKLNAKLEVLLVRKIGYPGSEEYAIGALAETSQPLFNEAETLSLDKAWLDVATYKAAQVNIQRAKDYRNGAPIISPTEKVAIIVDDGMATGLSMKAAVQFIKTFKPKYVVVCVPVATSESLLILGGLPDKIINLELMDSFIPAVGSYYEDFPQVEDSQVKEILEQKS